MTPSSAWGALPGLSRVESPGGGNPGGAAAGWELCPRTCVQPTRGQGREPPRGGARGGGRASGPMASLGGPLGLLLWLLLLEPRLGGARRMGRGRGRAGLLTGWGWGVEGGGVCWGCRGKGQARARARASSCLTDLPQVRVTAPARNLQ